MIWFLPRGLSTARSALKLSQLAVQTSSFFRRCVSLSFSSLVWRYGSARCVLANICLSPRLRTGARRAANCCLVQSH